MKQLIKKIIPFFIYDWYVNRDYYKYKKMHPKDIFTDIYEKNRWGSKESISGSGSELSQTQHLIKSLNQLLKEYEITSILDIPCGDFNWMRYVDLKNINYIGADIVEKLIEHNNQKFSNKSISFSNLNLIEDSLPKVDLIIIRDCFIHFSYNDILKALKNIKKSESRYLLTTTFVDCLRNENIITGSYRKINLLESPFYFPDPLLIIKENCTEDNGLNSDKSMLLWDISKIHFFSNN